MKPSLLITVALALVGCAVISFFLMPHPKIDVYGKVIDEAGIPVIGAKVDGTVLLGVDYFTPNVGGRDGGHCSTVTDAQGHFKFSVPNTGELRINIIKQGYRFDALDRTNWSNDYKTKSKMPYVFTIRKVE